MKQTSALNVLCLLISLMTLPLSAQPLVEPVLETTDLPSFTVWGGVSGGELYLGWSVPNPIFSPTLLTFKGEVRLGGGLTGEEPDFLGSIHTQEFTSNAPAWATLRLAENAEGYIRLLRFSQPGEYTLRMQFVYRVSGGGTVLITREIQVLVPALEGWVYPCLNADDPSTVELWAQFSLLKGPAEDEVLSWEIVDVPADGEASIQYDLLSQDNPWPYSARLFSYEAALYAAQLVGEHKVFMWVGEQGSDALFVWFPPLEELDTCSDHGGSKG